MHEVALAAADGRPVVGRVEGVTVIGTGCDLPGRVLDNDDVEVAADDWDRTRAGGSLEDWSVERLGVRRRHRLPADEGTATMATRASRRALADAGIDPAEVDLIVLSTFTSDHRLPQSVSIVQADLGTPAKCIQLEAACAGFLDGLAVAAAVLSATGGRHAVVVHSEAMSAVMDPRRFLLSAIFGDGAGAVVLRHEPDQPGGLGTWCTATSAHEGRSQWLRAGGGTSSPVTAERLADGGHWMEIEHKQIFPFAVERMAGAIEAVAVHAGMGLAEIDHVVAHQTGRNIAQGVAERTGIPLERFVTTLEHTGNTSGATIPIALDHARRAGLLAAGDRLVLPTVGAGMAWGAAALVWADLPAAGAPPNADHTDADHTTAPATTDAVAAVPAAVEPVAPHPRPEAPVR